MDKVVITGATSMIGIALIEECILHNIKVLAIVRKNSKHLSRLPKSDLVKVLFLNLESLNDFTEIKIVDIEEDYDVFYHFGWGYTDSEGRNNPFLQQKNIQYTLNAIELANKFNCQKFVGAGSQAEYGIITSNKINSKTNTNPISAYGISKYAAGRLVTKVAEIYSMNCLWVRILSVYGKYDNPNTMISSTISHLLKGEHASFTKAMQSWDYLYCKDAASAFYLIGVKSKGLKVYCLGNGESFPLYEYIYKMHTIINPSIEIGIGEIPYETLTNMNLCADISELQNDTGWNPKYSFDEGIRDIIKEI